MPNINDEKNIDISQQIRFVSHEIRNHLSVCDMYSQIIKKHLSNDKYENPSVENALNCIQKSLQIISMNVADLKSVNIEAPSVFDFRCCVERAVELSKSYIEDKDIQFEIFIKNTASLKLDENRILSCIVNILKNAVEAIEIRGKIQVLAEVKAGFAILKILNDGKPISADKQNKIFDCGYTSKCNGSGLGLAICKKYLNSQNAELELVKSNRKETVFKITLPICT